MLALLKNLGSVAYLEDGIPKSTTSEWLSILTLPSELQKKVDQNRISDYEATQISRKSKYIHRQLVAASE